MPIFNVWVLTPRGPRTITLSGHTSDEVRQRCQAEGYVVKKAKLVRGDRK